jgi:hypothetical protein
MTSVLPGARTPWDLIGSQIGQNISQNMPGAVQQGFQRQLGLNALEQAQQDIAGANGDPYKIALAFAKAGAQNPNLERSLGPLASTAMANAKLQNAFPDQYSPKTSPSRPQSTSAQGLPITAAQGGPPAPGQPQQSPDYNVQGAGVMGSTFATPNPFNIMLPAQMQEESQRYAKAVQDPAAASGRLATLENLNTIAQNQRKELENGAVASGVSAGDLPRFMLVGAKFDPTNQSEWLQNTKREYAKVRSADNALDTAFFPGIGNAILGSNRTQALKNLENPVQNLVKSGLEQETRKKLADNYLTPTEIESLIHPLTKEKIKALNELPKGDFPADTTLVRHRKPVMSYEETREKNPQKLKQQEETLANWFLKNVDNDTSLLSLRDPLFRKGDYDWRQIGPAIRQAEQMGLKLNPDQTREMAHLETQAPYQSLPEIFQDWDRFKKFLRGNK